MNETSEPFCKDNVELILTVVSYIAMAIFALMSFILGICSKALHSTVVKKFVKKKLHIDEEDISSSSSAT